LILGAAKGGNMKRLHASEDQYEAIKPSSESARVEVPAKKIPYFKLSKELRERLTKISTD
jgi:nucleoid DNA-binding protein